MASRRGLIRSARFPSHAELRAIAVFGSATRDHTSIHRRYSHPTRTKTGILRARRRACARMAGDGLASHRTSKERPHRGGPTESISQAIPLCGMIPPNLAEVAKPQQMYRDPIHFRRQTCPGGMYREPIHLRRNTAEHEMHLTFPHRTALTPAPQRAPAISPRPPREHAPRPALCQPEALSVCAEWGAGERPRPNQGMEGGRRPVRTTRDGGWECHRRVCNLW